MNRDDVEEHSLTEPSDADLLMSGDSASFGVFYDRHLLAILGWSYRRTGDADLAAEVTMETFAQAFVSRGRYRAYGTTARPWLFGIARNQIRQLARGRALKSRYREKLGLATSASLETDDYSRIEALVDFAPMRAEIRSAMATLPPREAQAVWLRVGLELPYETVAQRLGCSVGAARVRVVRGLSRLSDRLELA